MSPPCEQWANTLLSQRPRARALAAALLIWVCLEIFKPYSRVFRLIISGNVSYVVPGFHGIFAIPAEGVNHTPQFTAGAGSLESYKRAISCAAGMAIVGCRILDDAAFAEQVKADFLKGEYY